MEIVKDPPKCQIFGPGEDFSCIPKLDASENVVGRGHKKGRFTRRKEATRRTTFKYTWSRWQLADLGVSCAVERSREIGAGGERACALPVLCHADGRRVPISDETAIRELPGRRRGSHGACG